jgi:DNA invertase Pin-like site-specific DNA recombinase
MLSRDNVRCSTAAQELTAQLNADVLAMIAEFESDLISMRTREGMQVAKAKDRLRGTQPRLKAAQEAHQVELWRDGTHTSAELFSVARSTVYRAVQRAGEPNAPAAGHPARRACDWPRLRR